MEYFPYLLRLADNPLILGQRLCEWCGHGPVLEEDLALSNIALDLIGQARMLLTHAGNIEAQGRDEDQLAFTRPEHEFRNVTLVELPNGDFGRTVMRNFLFSAYQVVLYQELTTSRDSELVAIAASSIKESRYHMHHSADWIVRLGDGTRESHSRMQTALDSIWPYAHELFGADAIDLSAAENGIGVDPGSLKDAWLQSVLPVIANATLVQPPDAPLMSWGKTGRHSEHMGHLLADMQYLQRTYPGAQW